MVQLAKQELRVPAGEISPRPERRENEFPTIPAGKLRLDPYRLPQRVSAGDQDGFSYDIDRNGATVKRRLPCGLKLALALPARAFKGIAARSIECEDGSYTVSLELMHHDRALCLPLLVSDDMDDIAADWHAWSRMMRLPMLIVGADAIARPVRKQLGAIMIETAVERRKRFATLKHRPNFLRRRKPGVVGPVVKITGEELVARR
ncbi:MAG: DUF6101 family protein [Salaquimonas sp.]|jgi:hypothetical protein|nr:DUF6101 family protein [Salaquimonas sp.]